MADFACLSRPPMREHDRTLLLDSGLVMIFFAMIDIAHDLIAKFRLDKAV